VGVLEFRLFRASRATISSFKPDTFKAYTTEDFEKPIKPDAKPTFVYKGLNTPKTWREVNLNPLLYDPRSHPLE